jgi:hypothetical protein
MPVFELEEELTKCEGILKSSILFKHEPWLSMNNTILLFSPSKRRSWLQVRIQTEGAVTWEGKVVCL